MQAGVNKVDSKQNDQISALAKGGEAQKKSLKQLEENLQGVQAGEKKDYKKVQAEVKALQDGQEKIKTDA